jgi:hypothetical protein
MDNIEIQLIGGTRREVRCHHHEEGLAVIKSVEGAGYQIVHVPTGGKVGPPFWSLHHATLAARRIQSLGDWVDLDANPPGWMDEMRRAVPALCQDVTLCPSKYQSTN